MSLSFHSFSVATRQVPGNDSSVRAGSDQVLGILILDHFRDRLVVTLNHANRMRASRVQVVDVTGQRDRDHKISAPEATQLLILDLVAHQEGGDRLVCLDVPQLAGLVAGGRQKALVIGTPRNSVNTSSVGILSFRLEKKLKKNVTYLLNFELSEKLNIFFLIEV